MAHVVMCWELGGDLGHVARLKPLAEALTTRGHRVSFILRETLPAERLLDPKRYRWLQAPLQNDPVPDPMTPTRSFSQVLHNTGFHKREALLGHLRAWRNLFTALKPDLLVFDHSPTALLASRGLKTRRVLLGTGFGIPPQTTPLPAFDSGDQTDGLAAAEAQVLSMTNSVLAKLGEPPLACIADIYHAQASLLFTYPELDHYPQRQGGEYWGPAQQDVGAAPSWPELPGRRVFAYLKPFKTLPALLQTLKDAGHPTLVYLGKGAEQERKQFEGGTLRFTDRPVDLTQATAQAESVLCHAGHGTVSASLLAGKPLLLLPLNLEQHMLGQRVVQAGAGLMAPALAPEGMRQKFTRLMAEPAFTAAAQNFGERLAAHKVEPIPTRFVALAETLLAAEAV